MLFSVGKRALSTVIKSWKHKNLKRLYEKGEASGVQGKTLRG